MRIGNLRGRCVLLDGRLEKRGKYLLQSPVRSCPTTSANTLLNRVTTHICLVDLTELDRIRPSRLQNPGVSQSVRVPNDGIPILLVSYKPYLNSKRTSVPDTSRLQAALAARQVTLEVCPLKVTSLVS